MKSFDTFLKPNQEFQVKTACGGYLSICSLMLITILFVTELMYFLEVEKKDEMVIDRNQDKSYLDVTLDITFHGLPCALLSLNLVDAKKANVMHVTHGIYKTRLAPGTGEPIGKRIRDGLRTVADNSGDLSTALTFEQHEKAQAHASAKQRCGSCYYAHVDEDDCCTECDDVKQAFKERDWKTPTAYVVEQCEDDEFTANPPVEGEFCRLEADLYVRRVNSQIQMGVNHFLRHHLVPPETLSRVRAGDLNFSHTINGLSFGPKFPGLVDVLDGRNKTWRHIPGWPMTEHFQYDVHLIPTHYQPLGAEEIFSHQYSVTEYVKPIDIKGRRDAGLASAGIYLSYDITPFAVKVSEFQKPWIHFLTECCAILGGIFAFTGMLDNLSYRASKLVARKMTSTAPLDGGSGIASDLSQ